MKFGRSFFFPVNFLQLLQFLPSVQEHVNGSLRIDRCLSLFAAVWCHPSLPPTAGIGSSFHCHTEKVGAVQYEWMMSDRLADYCPAGAQSCQSWNWITKAWALEPMTFNWPFSNAAPRAWKRRSHRQKHMSAKDVQLGFWFISTNASQCYTHTHQTPVVVWI